MKLNRFTWELYKNSDKGKYVINEFEDVGEKEVDFIRRYNPPESNFLENIPFEDFIQDLWMSISDIEEINSIEDAKDLYEKILDFGLMIDGEVIVKEKDYLMLLGLNEIISFLLYEYSPEYFFPNTFRFHFFDLNKIADTYEIELPPIPKKSDLRARCMYYWHLCEVFYDFRKENGLTPQELCAFLYDYAPQVIGNTKLELPKPSQAWFIGGLISKEEKDLDITFWQGNRETKRGDILIHYETAPISAITRIWIAQTDGVVDPFFRYYSNTYVGDGIKIPHITLKDLQEDEYFSNHPLIRKNFQGINGWQATNEDYTNLLRMIETKGFDVSVLPKLYASELPKGLNIEKEHDVEMQLLEPLLVKMGWVKEKDFITQLPIHAGRGHRVFPDYSLHFDRTPDYEKAKVIFEVKKEMKNNDEIEEAFKQGRSYANILESSVLVLCDRYCLIVYQKGESFDRSEYIKIYWTDLENPDKYNELFNILNI